MLDSGTTTVTVSQSLAFNLCASSLPMMIGGSFKQRGGSGSVAEIIAGAATPGPAGAGRRAIGSLRSSTPGGHASSSSESTEPSIMCLSRSSTPRTSLGSIPLIATPDSSPLPRVASISAKMNGCTASTSGSISLAVFITSRYSANVVCDFITITCAFTPSTLSRNCFWNPVVTASTIVSAATPSTTPSTDTLVNTENTANSANAAVHSMQHTSTITPTGLAPCDISNIPTPAATPTSPSSASCSIRRSRLPVYRYRHPILNSYLTSPQLALDRTPAPACTPPQAAAITERARAGPRRHRRAPVAAGARHRAAPRG